MNFYMVLHQLTDWNLQKRIQGQTDTSLNETGRQNARELGRNLSGLGIDAIASSDLKRAAETAYIISERLCAPVCLEPRLRECGFGRLEGLTRDQIAERFSKETAGRLKNSLASVDAYDFREVDGEARFQVLLRVMSAMDVLTTIAKDKRILLVGHGRATHTLLRALGYDSLFPRYQYAEIQFPRVSVKSFFRNTFIEAPGR